MPAVRSCSWCPTVGTVVKVNPVQTSHQIPTIEPLPVAFDPDELRIRLADGWKCVRFESVVSVGFATLCRQSKVYLTESWQGRYIRGFGYSLGALLLGPWGVPWGLVWTPCAVWVNLTGGVDVTDNVRAWLDRRDGESTASAHQVAHPAR
jgi:hypothetical protein